MLRKGKVMEVHLSLLTFATGETGIVKILCIVKFVARSILPTVESVP